jgi:hypothetical protein
VPIYHLTGWGGSSRVHVALDPNMLLASGSDILRLGSCRVFAGQLEYGSER